MQTKCRVNRRQTREIARLLDQLKIDETISHETRAERPRLDTLPRNAVDFCIVGTQPHSHKERSNESTEKA